MSAQNTYAALLNLLGEAYLDNEKNFMAGGDETVKFLQAYLAVTPATDDPLEPIIRRVLFEWLQGASPENQAALDYLDNLASTIKNTPIPTASPTGAAHYLKVHFQKKAAGILALRLAKQTLMAHWRVMATLFYLEYCALPEFNPALIRFINTTPNNEWQQAAMNVLRSINDPDIKDKIKAEKIWLEGQKNVLYEQLHLILVSP